MNERRGNAIVPGLILAAALAAGCAPSPAERTYIVAALREHEAGEDRQALNLECARISVLGQAAEARYSVSYPMSQFAFAPIRARLEKHEGAWVVVSAGSGRPWWWHVLNHTIGVK